MAPLGRLWAPGRALRTLGRLWAPQVLPTMRLTPPEKGWRVKDHPAAVAIDALTLASRAPSVVYEVRVR